MVLYTGAPAPMFTAETPSNPRYAFASLGGFFLLLAFLPENADLRQQALGHMAAHRHLFDDERVAAFGVLRDERSIALARDQVGLRWFLDRDGALSRLYGALTPEGVDRPLWVIVDPSMRIFAHAPIDMAETMFGILRELPDPDRHAGADVSAPVLLAPRIFDPGLCRRLIEFYEADGGSPSGVMREVDGRTVPVLDASKSRRDAAILDEGFKAELRTAIVRRLLPEVEKAFQFRVTRMERYIVACYDAAERGFFRPHRDNMARAVAHRRFACTINLNAEDYEGGDLRFPEFGRRTYRAPTGGAVVFSCSLLHEATTVTQGRRYAFLPFFYDDAGARLREQNQQYLDPPLAAVD